LTNRKALKSGLLEECKELGVIPLIRNPLDTNGLASGRYTATNPSGGDAGSASGPFKFSLLEKLQPLHQVQETIAERVSNRIKRENRRLRGARRSDEIGEINTDITTTQVAINYVVAHGGVPLVDVYDTESAGVLKGCLGWSLTDEEMDMLDKAANLCEL
jgi:aryl-alcohol dehydrogenase-like predicted oxidoreductase